MIRAKLSQAEPHRVRVSILTKLTIFVSLVVVLSATLMNWIGYRFAHQSLTEQIHERLDTVANHREAQINNYVAQEKKRALLVASRTRLREILAERINKQDSLADFHESTQSILRDARESLDEFLEIWFADPDGRVVATTDDQYLNRDFATDVDFQEGKNGSHLGTPWKVENRFQAHLTCPAHSHDGQFLGVLMVLVDVQQLQELLIDRAGLGSTGEVLVAARDGDVLRYLIPPHDQPDQLSVSPKLAQMMVQAIDNVAAGRDIGDYDGRTVLAAWRTLDYRIGGFPRWGMVVKMDEREAFAPIASLRRLQWGLEAILVAMGIGCAFLLAKRFTRPILRLADTAEKIARGDLDARAPVATMDELGELAAAFNEMAEQLSQSHAALERRVERRTGELAHANEALEKSNLELQQFAYIASHDLQSPLRAVVSFAQLLREDQRGQISAKADRYIDSIVASCKRMQQLIDDVLEYSRVESRSRPFEAADLNEVVDEAVTALQSSIEDSGGQVTRDTLPTVKADRAQLFQLLQNLIGNGLKYCRDESPRVHVSAEHKDGEWELAVRDNGIGIETKHHERIFEIFRRLHSEDQYPGTGIGLAICRRIVARHGGTIWVESERENGSIFRFTIPSK